MHMKKQPLKKQPLKKQPSKKLGPLDLIMAFNDDLELGSNQGIIYEVPRNIRQVSEKAYTPQTISIGPIHSKKKNLTIMATHKVKYAKKFHERTSDETLNYFLEYIEGKKKEIYNSYQALIDEDEFVLTIFYDALFIVELFLRKYDKENGKNSEIKDLLLNETWSAGLRRDFILLENQIPMSVLEKAYRLYREQVSVVSALTFLELACYYFGIQWDQQMFEGMEPPHFTALLRCHMIKNWAFDTDKDTDEDSQRQPLKPEFSATSLHEVGIKLTVDPNETACLLDLKYEHKNSFEKKYKHNKLIIPKFTVHSNIEAYIRNVMAFEMCHYPEKAYVCAYLELMNYLIQTPKDVAFLMKEGILSMESQNEGELVSGTSNTIMKNMIKKLMQGVGQRSACYQETTKLLIEDYKDAQKFNLAIYIKRSLRIVLRRYSADPWRISGSIACLIILILTFIQTVMAFRK